MKDIFYTYYLNYEIGINYFLDSKKGIVKNFERVTDNPNFMLSDIDYLTTIGPNIDELSYDYSNYTEEYTDNFFEKMDDKIIKKDYYMCLRHYGSYETLNETYKKLFNHIKNSNKKICGLPMEQYVDGRWNKDNEKDYMTIVMIPIKIDIEMVVVNDSKRVNEKLNMMELIENDNLLIKNPMFCKLYMEYLDTKSLIKLKHFYNETELKIDHIYIDKNQEEVTLTENGWNIEYDYPYNLISNSHITVVSYVDEIKIEDNKLYIDNELIKDLYLKGSYNFNRTIDDIAKMSLMPLKRQKEYIKNTYNPKNSLACVKQIHLTPFNDYYFLKENGNLILDNKVYDKNIETIWNRDSIRSYIIYKDNSCVLLTCNGSNKNYKKYKTIKYSNHFLALLREDKRLILFIKPKGTHDEVIFESFNNIDNIEYIYHEDEDIYNKELKLKCNNSEIIIYPNEILIDNSAIYDQDIC